MSMRVQQCVCFARSLSIKNDHNKIDIFHVLNGEVSARGVLFLYRILMSMWLAISEYPREWHTISLTKNWSLKLSQKASDVIFPVL